MAAYLILGIIVMLGTIPGIAKLFAHRQVSGRKVRIYLVTILALFVLTAVFDNLIVGLGIVGYDRSKILGLYVGYAPVEDFFYPLVAAYLLPILWSGK